MRHLMWKPHYSGCATRCVLLRQLRHRESRKRSTRDALTVEQTCGLAVLIVATGRIHAAAQTGYSGRVWCRKQEFV